jgi:hypothetical protein
VPWLDAGRRIQRVFVYSLGLYSIETLTRNSTSKSMSNHLFIYDLSNTP